MIWIIAKREIVTRVRTKSFRFFTAVLFVGILAIAFLQNILNDDSARRVTIGVDNDGVALIDALSAGTEDLDPTVIETTSGVADLESGDIDVLFDGESLTWDGRPDGQLGRHISSVVQQRALGQRADELGLSPGDVGQLLTPVEIEEVNLNGDEEETNLRQIAALGSGFATFILLQIWGGFMMMGVIEEKSSKVVEVLLSHVRPATLLGGKLVGLGVLAIGQMLVVAVSMALALTITRDIEVPTAVWVNVPLLVLTFLLGFAFYASAYAAVGAMVSRQEDAQVAQLPATLPLLSGYIIASTGLGSPDNLAIKIGSFVPFTSPVVLPVRTAATDVPWWQVALSLAILAVSIVFMVRLAGWIYRYSLLRAGSRVTWREVLGNRQNLEL